MHRIQERPGWACGRPVLVLAASVICATLCASGAGAASDRWLFGACMCATRMGHAVTHCAVPVLRRRPQFAGQHADGHVPVQRHRRSPGGICGELRPVAGAGACTAQWQQARSFARLTYGHATTLLPGMPPTHQGHCTRAHACLLRTRPQAPLPPKPSGRHRECKRVLHTVRIQPRTSGYCMAVPQCMTLESWALEHCLGMDLPSEVEDEGGEELNAECMEKVLVRNAQGFAAREDGQPLVRGGAAGGMFCGLVCAGCRVLPTAPVVLRTPRSMGTPPIPLASGWTACTHLRACLS